MERIEYVFSRTYGTDGTEKLTKVPVEKQTKACVYIEASSVIRDSCRIRISDLKKYGWATLIGDLFSLYHLPTPELEERYRKQQEVPDV